MINQIIGIILIFASFIAILFYSSFREGFLKITLYIAIFHFTLSIVTQIFHIFNYEIIITAHIIFVLSLFILHYLKGKDSFCSFKKIISKIVNVLKNNWMLLGSILVIFLLLFSVYNSYNGPALTIHGVKIVKDSTYLYPFVSDEWVTISEINYSIEKESIPIVNPLDHDIPIPNILFAFPSVLAEIFLILSLNPLNYYWIISIFFGMFLCVSLYVLLRTYKVSGIVSGITILFVPYITNSGNLLALWALLPFTFGTIFLVWQVISQKMGYDFFAISFSILALIFYPPMVVFVVPSLLIYLFQSKKDKIKNIKQNILRYIIPLIVIIIIFVSIFYFILMKFDITLFGIFTKYFIRPNLDNGIVLYSPWHVVPVIVIIFGLIGIYKVVKEKYWNLLILLGIGSAYWILYSFILKVFIIENIRIVFITSVFIIIISGIGIEALFLFFIKKINQPKINQYVLNGLGLFVLIVSLLLVSSYSSRSSWQKTTLILRDEKGDKRLIVPAPPINRYLTDEDLNLFKDIHKENFISIPWKGLVIGVATGNYPFETKSATIANGILPYYVFMNLNCEDKRLIAKKLYISYVYSEEFLCKSFEKIGLSYENLHFYKFIR